MPVFLVRIRMFFMLWRLRFQMWRTGRKQAPLKSVGSFREIQDRLGWGDRYKPDPRGGKHDVLYHPRRVQHWIDGGHKVGDCDDHAGYWIGCVRASRLVDETYLGLVFGLDIFGHKGGHAVAVFHRRAADGAEERLWVDYELPRPVAFGGDEEWDWAKFAARGVGITTITHAALIPVTKLSKRQALVFGRPALLERRKDPIRLV